MEQWNERFEMVPIEAVCESARNPRKTFKPGPLAELTESIRSIGVTSPLIARPLPADPALKELAAGHRRLRASKLAGRTHVPVIIRDYSEDEYVEVLAVENIQREDVHPLEEAEGFRELLRRPNWDVPSLAIKVGKDESYVYRRLKLLDLTPEVKEMFLAERILPGHAHALAPLQPETQKRLAKELGDQNGGVISVAALRAEIERSVYLDLKKAPFPISDSQLLPKAGSCHDCTKRSGANPCLIPEVKAKDVCWDRSCYYQKQNAHASAQSAKLTKELGERPLWVSTADQHQSDKKKDVLHDGTWREVKKSAPCESARKAVVVEAGRWSRDKQSVGEVIEVCTNKRCRIHWGGNSFGHRPAPTAAEQLRELGDREETDRAEELRRLRIAAAVGAAKYPIEPELFRELASVMWHRLGHDSRVKVLSRRGLKQLTAGVNRQADVMEQAIRKARAEDLAGLVVEIAIMEDRFGRPDDSANFLSIALAGVNNAELKQREETVAAEVKAAYDVRRARIEKAEAKRKADEKAAKKAAAPAATKGKGRK